MQFSFLAPRVQGKNFSIPPSIQSVFNGAIPPAALLCSASAEWGLSTSASHKLNGHRPVHLLTLRKAGVGVKGH